MVVVAFLFLNIARVLAAPIRPDAPVDYSRLRDDSIKKWSGAEVLALARITNVVAGPVGLSEPPLRTYTLEIVPEKILRGPAKLAAKLKVHFAIRQSDPPSFPAADKTSLVALTFVRGAWELRGYDDATPDKIEQAKLAISFPLGWTLRDGKLISPWATVGKKAAATDVACSVTGRPVLLAGSLVRFTAEPMPPKKKFEFKNPDGDGDYKVTVKNDTDQELEISALLTDGKAIRWNESIVLRCAGKTYPIPGSTGDVRELKPVVLKPGESVSGQIQALAIEGPEWPRGGDRVEFQFCLGERSATQSFYYFSNHHDPIRAEIKKKAKAAN
jgi:hypothetical protein